MLAKRRSIKLNGVEKERTPLLVPSFSSKGFPDVKKIIEYMSETIDGVTLVSAYDLHHRQIESPFDFPSLIFLDSGGYEASKDADLSDFAYKQHIIREWTQDLHETVLAKWNPSVPSVLISYDHPKERLTFSQQVERAKAMAPGRKEFIRELLLKPETLDQHYLQIATIVNNIQLLTDFDIIGVTEKEVGNSVLHRMQNIAKLRRALSSIGLETPIHVFGSLDTVTTPLYFLAGADIFDGLTWLRFAYHEGQTIYKQNYGACILGVKAAAHFIDGRCWNNNYYYMKDLELEMRRYLSGDDITAFRFHRELFKNALASTTEEVGE